MNLLQQIYVLILPGYYFNGITVPKLLGFDTNALRQYCLQ